MTYRFDRTCEMKHGHEAREKVFEHNGVTIVLRKELNCSGREVGESVWMSNKGWTTVEDCKAWVEANSGEQARHGGYDGRREHEMSERYIEELLQSESDEETIRRAIEEYLSQDEAGEQPDLTGIRGER